MHALYNRSRVVLVALLAGFAASFCATFFGMYSAADHLQFDEQCLISSAPRIMILVWWVLGRAGLAALPARCYTVHDMGAC